MATDLLRYDICFISLLPATGTLCFIRTRRRVTSAALQLPLTNLFHPLLLLVRLLVLLVATLLLLGSSSQALALDTARATSAVWRGEGKVDVFLRVETNDE